MAEAVTAKSALETERCAPTPEAPGFAFDPTDPWTQTFQKGLERADLARKAVYEVGIGTGINAAFVLRMCRASAFYGSDLDPRLVELAERNVARLTPEHAEMFQPVRGAVSSIDTEEALAKIARHRCGHRLYPASRRSRRCEAHRISRSAISFTGGRRRCAVGRSHRPLLSLDDV